MSPQSCKGLLLHADRKPEWISHRHIPSTILQIPPHWPHIRDEKLTLRVVVLVISFSLRKQERTLHAPARSSPELEPSSRQKRLRCRVANTLHSPGPQILRQNSRGESIAELVLQPHVARGIEILIHRGVKEQLANRVSREQSSPAPGPSHREFHLARNVART